jgi:hypothetical protein
VDGVQPSRFTLLLHLYVYGMWSTSCTEVGIWRVFRGEEECAAERSGVERPVELLGAEGVEPWRLGCRPSATLQLVN